MQPGVLKKRSLEKKRNPSLLHFATGPGPFYCRYMNIVFSKGVLIWRYIYFKILITELIVYMHMYRFHSSFNTKL